MSMNLKQLVEKNNENTRTSKYTTYDSKKKLLSDTDMMKTLSAFNTDFLTLIKALKNVFSIAIYNADNRYIVITMYYSTTKKYEYVACNVETLDCVSYDSIKMAKTAITELLVKAEKAEK